jgi:crossover junction endodeoxyribonuclease RuvC
MNRFTANVWFFMRILGIDPAFRVTGFGVIDVVRFTPRYVVSGSINVTHLPDAQRLLKLQESIASLIAQFKPDVLAIESPFVYKNPQSAIKLGMARGVIMAAAAKEGLLIAEYTPTQIKSAIVGKGHALKTQVQYMITQLLGLSESPSEDAADALACGLTHAKIAAFSSRITA